MKTNQRSKAQASRNGAMLVLVAGFMLVGLAVAALAVDMAMGFASRAEAQRIADSAALAGGSAYMEMDADVAGPTIRDRAFQYALRHTIRGEAVDSSEVTIQVLPDEMKVRVAINRQGLPTWFARMFGIDVIDVGAIAAAQAFQAGEAQCVKPWAIPDIWHDENGDTDGDGAWDEGEDWEWGDDEGDYYERWELDDPDAMSATGYGSLARNDNGEGIDRDYGRRLHLKISNPQSNYSMAPGLFFPFRLPEFEGQEDCAQGGGGGGGGNQDAGANVYRNNICSCNPFPVQIGDTFDVEPGNMIGPTKQGTAALIDDDPEASWDESTGSVVNSIEGSNWLASPRVVRVALFEPAEIDGSGMQSIVFNNIALMFIEEQVNQQDDVTGRFIKYASGTGLGEGGENVGSLILFLRLVE